MRKSCLAQAVTGHGGKLSTKFHLDNYFKGFLAYGAKVAVSGRRKEVLSQTARELDSSGERVAIRGASSLRLIALGDVALVEIGKKSELP
jgi:hypothetical protein